MKSNIYKPQFWHLAANRRVTHTTPPGGVPRAAHRIRPASVLLLAATILCSAALQAQTPGSEPLQKTSTVPALFLSDIHLNPFPDAALLARLSGDPSPAPQTSPIDEAALAAAQQECRSLPDTTSDLLQSSLAAMKPRAASIRFVTVTGDLVAHQFIRCYTAYVLHQPPQSSESGQYQALTADQRTGYREFVLNTIRYVTGGLRETFPNVPIYYALGNNDSDCGDYDLDPNSDFLKSVAEITTKSLPATLSETDIAAARADFSTGGYYTVPLTALPHTRLIVLDDVFMSPGYQTCSGTPDPAPAAAQRAWLVSQLEALKPGENVWIMGHIPPGMNPFDSAKSMLRGGGPVNFLKFDFSDVLTSHNKVIRLALFAHTHFDDLSPLSSPDGANSVTLKLVQSISPGHGNLPAYTLAGIDPKTSAITQYTLVTATSTGAAKYTWPAANAPLPPPTWPRTTTSPH